jgi:hypothetical protein
MRENRKLTGTPPGGLGSAAGISTDEAMGLAREEIKSARFLKAFHRFPGFEKAALVYDNAGFPITGEVLYLRESIHTVDIDGKYALTGDEVRGAGNATMIGTDQDNYLTRVGLGRYYMDVNGYLKNGPVQTMELPRNAAYIPAEALLTANIPNLLVPGYAQCSDSAAWSMMRVIPNLNVCGDAAGVIAAYCVIYKSPPLNILTTHLEEIQQTLRKAGVNLEKK